MRYAIISVSEKGSRLGADIKERLKNDTIDLYERKGSESGADASYFSRTVALTAQIFNQYDGLIFIMACGIVVRAIAPCVEKKTKDPAVLCLDECGKHCISLLSGHLGGANDLCLRVAQSIHADPVITTATDVHGAVAPDEAARKLYMRIEPVSALKAVNTVVAAHKNMLWLIDDVLCDYSVFNDKLRRIGIRPKLLKDYKGEPYDACAIITNREIPMKSPCVYLRPRNLFVGIGCKRGVPEEEIEKAFFKALEMIRAKSSQVASLASVILKSDEAGLLSFASRHHWPIHFYKTEELNHICELYHLESSPFVKEKIGVGNVCQSAALMESKQGIVLLPKTKFQGITISIAMGRS